MLNSRIYWIQCFLMVFGLVYGNGEEVGNYYIMEKQVEKNMEHAMDT